MEKEIYLIQGTSIKNWSEATECNVEINHIDTFCKVWTIDAYNNLSEAEEEVEKFNSEEENTFYYFIRKIKLY